MKKLEEQMREKFQDFEIQPREKVWKQINSQLHPLSSSRFDWKPLAAAACLLISGFAVYYYMGFGVVQNNNNALVASNNTTIYTPKAAINSNAKETKITIKDTIDNNVVLKNKYPKTINSQRAEAIHAPELSIPTVIAEVKSENIIDNNVTTEKKAENIIIGKEKKIETVASIKNDNVLAPIASANKSDLPKLNINDSNKKLNKQLLVNWIRKQQIEDVTVAEKIYEIAETEVEKNKNKFTFENILATIQTLRSN